MWNYNPETLEDYAPVWAFTFNVNSLTLDNV